jgi:hypothetical protein
LTTDELFKFGDAELILVGLWIFLEEGVQTFESRGLPVAKQLWLEVMLAAKFRLAGGAGQEFENALSFEVSGKRTSLAWHEKFSLRGPVYNGLLVQRKGRISQFRFPALVEGGQRFQGFHINSALS